LLLGRVIGTVTTSVGVEGMTGVPLLIVEPLDKAQKPAGKPVVCADATRQAGRGQTVYYEGGREAAMMLDPWFVPVDHAIVGIVDGVSLHR